MSQRLCHLRDARRKQTSPKKTAETCQHESGALDVAMFSSRECWRTPPWPLLNVLLGHRRNWHALDLGDFARLHPKVAIWHTYDIKCFLPLFTDAYCRAPGDTTVIEETALTMSCSVHTRVSHNVVAPHPGIQRRESSAVLSVRVRGCTLTPCVRQWHPHAQRATFTYGPPSYMPSYPAGRPPEPLAYAKPVQIASALGADEVGRSEDCWLHGVV